MSETFLRAFPDRKYNIIYADPPWQVKRGPKHVSEREKEPGNGPSRPLEYEEMSLREISNIPVKTIIEPDAVLFIWTINKYIEQTYGVARAWGFKPSTMLTWTKTPNGLGIGGTFTNNCEYLLFCRRGTLKAQKRVSGTHFWAPRGKHSQKPAMFRDMITECFGHLLAIELFAREHFLGWDAWGNEA